MSSGGMLPANAQDRDGAQQLFAKAFKMYGRLRWLWADGGYAGQLVAWVGWASRCMMEIMRRSDTACGFTVLARRWVVERTFGWLGRSRRLSRDYERTVQVAEAFVYLACAASCSIAGAKLTFQTGSQGYTNRAVVAELKFGSPSHLCHEFKRVYGKSPQSFNCRGQNVAFRQ